MERLNRESSIRDSPLVNTTQLAFINDKGQIALSQTHHEMAELEEAGKLGRTIGCIKEDCGGSLTSTD